MRWTYRLALAGLVAAAPAANGSAALARDLPAGAVGPAFYIAPSPLPAGTHGDVIWSRPMTGGPALPSAAKNVLVLYLTTTVAGDPIAVSGTVAIPHGTPPAGGWPVISWAHGTIGNGPKCAPSVEAHPNVEERMLDRYVARGYAVVQTDYEGEGTPGIHPYFVGKAAGRDVADMVRAARQIDPTIGTRWVTMGHSEGGSAALFTAAVAPTWTPELSLLGTVAFAPASHLISALRYSMTNQNPDPFFPFTLMMIDGMAMYDPSIDLKAVLSPAALAQLPELRTHCLDDVFNDRVWSTTPAARFFASSTPDASLTRDFLANEDSLLALHVPALVLQGDADTVVGPQATKAMVALLCKNGATIEFDTFSGRDHDSIMDAALDNSERWVDARFAGAPAKSNCS